MDYCVLVYLESDIVLYNDTYLAVCSSMHIKPGSEMFGDAHSYMF